MKVIYRYDLDDWQHKDPTIQLPLGRKIIKAAYHRGKLSIWAVVDPKVRSVDVKFVIVPTGGGFNDEFLDTHTHIDTVIDGPYIWHLYQHTP